MQPSKNPSLAICKDMDELEGIMLSEISSIRERQFSYDLSDMRNLRDRVGGNGGKGGKK